MGVFRAVGKDGGKCLVFDSGPIISLTTNNLLWLLKPLKARFGGRFVISESVREELVRRPLVTKKFKFEALQVERLIEDGVIEVVGDPSIRQDAAGLLDAANRIFTIKGEPLRAVQLGEMESLVIAKRLNAQAVAVDERVTRLLVEDPSRLERVFFHRLHARVRTDVAALRAFRQRVQGIRVIRSVELVTVAFELGLLDDFITQVPNARKELLESVLWGVKLHGAAVSEQEILYILKLKARA
jgi:predicted nucleic acid-binding protein